MKTMRKLYKKCGKCGRRLWINDGNIGCRGCGQFYGSGVKLVR